jgi:hypothetical protein
MRFNPLTKQMEESEDIFTVVPKAKVANVVGPKGDKGDIGPQGDRGFKGDSGERGIPGINGEKGSKGDAGQTGAQGIPGDVGPKGDKGDPGQRGQIGLKGENGKDGTPIYYTAKMPSNDLGSDGEWTFNAFREVFHKESGNWKFYSMMGGGAAKVRNIQDIGNVKLTNLTIGDNLQWNGSYWSNSQEDALANLNIQLDVVDATVTYIGYAQPGALTSAASWKIKKITTTGDDIAITWADGNVNFDNIWNDHASLTYS